MSKKKICGDCPWRDNQRIIYSGYCPIGKWKFSNPECPSRRAYRILQDEVRRLRVIPTEDQLDGFEFMWDSAEYISHAKEYPVVRELLTIIRVLLDKLDAREY